MSTWNTPAFITAGGPTSASDLTLVANQNLLIRAFERNSLFWEMRNQWYRYRRVTSPTSQFLLGRQSAEVETMIPGIERAGQHFEYDKATVTVDAPIVRDVSITFDQKIYSADQVDIVTDQVVEIGAKLAREIDSRLCRLMALAARGAAKTNYHGGGNRVVRAGGAVATAYPNTSTGADNFLLDLGELAKLMDQDDLPNGEGDRAVIITPEIRQVLTNNTNIFNGDFNRGRDASANSRNSRRIGTIQGFDVYVYNGMPSTNVTTGPSKYQANFAASAGASAGQPVAVAVVRPMGDKTAIAVNDVLGGVELLMTNEADLPYKTAGVSHYIQGRAMLGGNVVTPFMAGEIAVYTAS